MSALYLYEFLYRGRPPGSAEAPDYHVVLAEDETDSFGGTHTALSPALTPDQASAKGFALPAILSAINTETMAENTRLKGLLAGSQTKGSETEAGELPTLPDRPATAPTGPVGS